MEKERAQPDRFHRFCAMMSYLVWAKLAPTGGFEPLTYRLGGGCSILLSYVGM